MSDSTKPTIASVEAVLADAGFPAYAPGRDGFRVGLLEGGVIRVDYDPGRLPIDRDAALATIAGLLSAKGWMVTDAGRVLVSANPAPPETP